MTLFRLNGAAPARLPAVFHASNGDCFTALDTLSGADLAALGFVPAPVQPEFDPVTHRADWNAEDETWMVVEAPPPPAPEARRISRVRFKNELLTPDELIAYNRARRDVAALTPADYDDPAKALLVQAEILLDYMDDATAIELDNPKTVLGVEQIMVGLGILTSPRAAQVLADQEP
ncbi:MAG: hypothetical protein ACK4IW_09905 [Brevundimonas aurantiaca]